MAVSSLVTNITYVASGASSSFVVPFYFISQNDLLVQSIDSLGNVLTYALNTDYVINGTTNLFGDYNNGGLVVFNAPPAAGLTILITRNTPRNQAVLLIDGQPYTADTFNHVFDKLTLITQESIIPGYKGLALGPPTAVTATYQLGDWFKNANPIPGGVFGWECTTLGAPGTWRAIAPISLI